MRGGGGQSHSFTKNRVREVGIWRRRRRGKIVKCDNRRVKGRIRLVIKLCLQLVIISVTTLVLEIAIQWHDITHISACLY